MRVDEKVEGPRQSMSWLHTWSSLILGWLLYAIFVTGTLSFFQTEISAWMKPEFHQSIPHPSSIQQTKVAIQYLQTNHPNAGSWNIQLPHARQNTTVLNVRQQGEDLNARRGGERIIIDSATGEVLEARDTRGGSFLYRFHFELYAIPRTWARWMIGIATMFMMVAIISGVITHKKIFKDFFTFRRGKGQRSWLDAHNATAVFALPFHIMITFSGLLLLLFTLMPWGVNQIYDNRRDFLEDQYNTLIPDDPISNQNKKVIQTIQERERHDQARSDKTHARESTEQTTDQIEFITAPLTNITPLVSLAQEKWQDNPIGSIKIIAPNTTEAKIEMYALNAVSVAHRGVYQHLEFNGVTGQLTHNPNNQIQNPSIPNGIYNVLTVLHEARGVDLALRWLLFFSGIVGTLMVATGLILWCVKRAPQQEKQGFKSFGYRLVEALNITAIIGLPIACAVYFYANRFIPSDLDLRLNWEIRSFFISWLLVFFYCLCRSQRQAWLVLLAFASFAYALLPIINGMTGGIALTNSISNDLWLIATFDIAMWALSLIFLFIFFKVKNHQNTKRSLAKSKHKIARSQKGNSA